MAEARGLQHLHGQVAIHSRNLLASFGVRNGRRTERDEPAFFGSPI